MKAVTASLRGLGLLAVVTALLDPGCARSHRPTLEVAFTGDLGNAARTQELARITADAPWATVLDAHRPQAGLEGTPRPTRVVVGDAAPVLAALEERPAALAWQATAPSLVVAALHAPARIVSGTRADIAVTVGDVPEADTMVRVVIADAVSGQEQARAELRIAANTRVATVPVSWLATRVGEQRLRVVASTPGDASIRPSAPADVTVDVRPAVVRVDVLEARPTWAARFARLALGAVAGVDLHTEVRVAPGIAARTASTGDGAPSTPRDAEVVLVGGVDALTPNDVTRLETGTRDRGQAVVLLLDEPPGAGPWRRLWPDFSASVRTAPTPTVARIGGHGWKVGEWLDVRLSTGGTPLASLESSSTPIVVGRALGAGRVVIVTALDAWRWRADDDAAFAAGWRALVQRLGTDVPPALAMTTWGSGRGRTRTLQVDVTARPDVVRAGIRSVTARVDSRLLPLRQVGAARWRGAMRVGAAATAPVPVDVRAGDDARMQARTVVDPRPPALVASWEDVARYQEARGLLAAGREARSVAMRRLHESLPPSDGERWFVTRTWWFAGLALCALGAEWILRRLAGAR